MLSRRLAERRSPSECDPAASQSVDADLELKPVEGRHGPAVVETIGLTRCEGVEAYVTAHVRSQTNRQQSPYRRCLAQGAVHAAGRRRCV